MTSPERRLTDVRQIPRRVGWRDVGYCWVAAVVMTALLLLSL